MNSLKILPLLFLAVLSFGTSALLLPQPLFGCLQEKGSLMELRADLSDTDSKFRTLDDIKKAGTVNIGVF